MNSESGAPLKRDGGSFDARLGGALSATRSPALHPSLPTDFLPAPFHLEHVSHVDSTNSEILRRLALGSQAASACEGLVLWADEQSAGRGRQGRVWHARTRQCLMFSLAWRVVPSRCAGLSLVVGWALWRAAQALGAQHLALKWPNDLLWRDANGQWHKLAGVLIELSGSMAVIGMGVNLTAPEITASSAASASATVLHAAGLDRAMPSSLAPEPSLLLWHIVRELGKALPLWQAQGFAALREAWQSVHAWQDENVGVWEKDRCLLSGRCLGVAEDGALRVLDRQGQEQRIIAGDVSLRWQAAVGDGN